MTRLAFAFAAGVLSPLNPCGFALLPAYLAYYLGAGEAQPRPMLDRVSQGLAVGGALSAGFAGVFVLGGLLISLGLRSLISAVPIGAVVIGVVLAGVGALMLAGRRAGFLTRFLTKRQVSPGSGTRYRHIVVFGAGYAFASLACTIAVLLAVIAVALGAHNPAQLVGVLVAYGTGAATLLMALTLSAALAKQSLQTGTRRLLPFVERVAAVLLILSGAYLVLTNLPGLDHTAVASGIYARVSGLSSRLANLVDPHWQAFVPVAGALAALVGVALWRRRRSSGPRRERFEESQACASCVPARSSLNGDPAGEGAGSGENLAVVAATLAAAGDPSPGGRSAIPAPPPAPSVGRGGAVGRGPNGPGRQTSRRPGAARSPGLCDPAWRSEDDGG